MSLAEAVAAVRDPELRVLTIAELGILRDVTVESGRAVVTITPTYAGCPAMDVIRRDIHAAARTAGYPDVDVVTVLRPAWTTDWIDESAKAKLAAAGIVPPGPASRRLRRPALPLALSAAPPAVVCPRCGSPDTEQLARFGSTACKALWRCRVCAEPFDSIKAL
jgi:ring-1,2-phenylacetyl-CoA epoxidase subunit PaaD